MQARRDQPLPLRLGRALVLLGFVAVSAACHGDPGVDAPLDTDTSAPGATAETLRVMPDPGQSKVAGDDDPPLTFTHDGDDTVRFTGTLARKEGEDAGTYEITLGDLAAEDHAITLTDEVFTITPLADTGSADEPIELDREALPPSWGDQVAIRVSAGPFFDWIVCKPTQAPAVAFSTGVVAGRAKYGNLIAVCFTGFDLERPLQVLTVAPDGTESRRTLGADYVEDAPTDTDSEEGPTVRSYQLLFAALPDLTAGEYRIVASQGEATATARFDLLDEAKTAMWVVPRVDSDLSLFLNPDFRPGDDVEIAFTGLPAGETFDLHLFGEPAGEAALKQNKSYFGGHTVQAADDGTAWLRIATSERERGLVFCPLPDPGVMREIFDYDQGEPSVTTVFWCRSYEFTIGEDRRPEN